MQLGHMMVIRTQYNRNETEKTRREPDRMYPSSLGKVVGIVVMSGV